MSITRIFFALVSAVWFMSWISRCLVGIDLDFFGISRSSTTDTFKCVVTCDHSPGACLCPVAPYSARAPPEKGFDGELELRSPSGCWSGHTGDSLIYHCSVLHIFTVLSSPSKYWARLSKQVCRKSCLYPWTHLCCVSYPLVELCTCVSQYCVSCLQSTCDQCEHIPHNRHTLYSHAAT